MPSSAGLLTPRGPFSGAAPLALRPLSAIAASVAGGVPEARIKRLLSDLLPSLISLHAQGEICGDISLETVGMDESARAHLVPELIVARSRRVSRTPTPGFAPFELYTDSMEWPRGPWSDIYALCAVMHTLVTGRRPPPAPERRAADHYEPLASLGLSKYSQEFLAVVDAGLSMAPADRPQTLAELAERLGIAAQAETAPAQAEAAAAGMAETAPVAAAARARPSRGGRFLLWLLFFVVLAGAGAYAWFASGLGAPNALITSFEVVQPNPPAVHPQPQVAQTAPTPPPAAQQSPAPESQAQAGAVSLESSAPSAPPADAPATAQTQRESAFPEAPAVTDEETPKPKPVPVPVRLDIRPWGEVWINGVARGISPPIKEIKLIPGKYQVVLRNANLPPYRATLEVKAGKPGVISHVFQ